MLKQQSVLFAVAAALIAAAPVCFAQTGTIGTFGANPGVGPAPITGGFNSAPGSIPGGFNSAPGSFGSAGGTFGSPPSVAIPSIGSQNTFGPAPIVGAPPSISPGPSVTSPRVLGPAPTSPGVVGGGPMGFCVPGSIANPC